MRNWDDFCLKAKKLAASSFSFSEFQTCLSLIDPTVFIQLSLPTELLIRSGLCRYRSWRQRLLRKPIAAFAKKNGAIFAQAPREAIDAYNALMTAFFTPDLKITFTAVEHPSVTQTKPVEISPLERRQLVEKKMEEFRRSQESVLPFLFQAYVDEFLVEMRAEMDRATDMEACQKRLLAALDLQKAGLARLDKEIREGNASLKKKSIQFLEKLYSPELVVYKDLLLHFEKIVKADDGFQLPEKKWLTDETFLEIDKASELFFRNLLDEIANLVETGKKRNVMMHEIDLFQKKTLNVTERLKFYKDLAKEREELEEKYRKITFSKKELQTVAPGNMAAVIEEKHQRYLALFSEISQLVISLNQRCKQYELWGEYGKQTIKRRLFEIFFGITPYKELREEFDAVRAVLVQKLVYLVDAFYGGVLGSDEYLAQCQEMAYEHDVVKLRNEITYRSSRLKDIRDEVIHLFKEVSELRRLLDVIPGAVQEKVYREIAALFQEIKVVLHKIENPFQLFEKVETKDETNLIFRSFWIQVEKIQLQVEKAKQHADLILKKNVGTIKTRFLRFADLVEEVIYQSEGSRPVLVAQMNTDFRYVPEGDMWAALMEQKKLLEKKFPFAQPSAFFLQISDSDLCLEMLKEARKIEEMVSNVRSFAKAMQFIKTFEEEYVDVILEAFEREYVIDEEQCDAQAIKTAWKKYTERMYRSCSLVKEEILLDIGLLDMRALMDVDQTKLIKILKIAIERAHLYIKDPLSGLMKGLTQLESAGPYASTSQNGLCQKTYQELKSQILQWDTEPSAQKVSSNELLEKLRTFCLYLFNAKVLISAVKDHTLAKSLAFIAELRTFCNILEHWLQETRGQMGAAWEKSWIAECYALRREIAHFEMQIDGFDTLKAFTSKFFTMVSQVPEIVHYKSLQEDPINLQIMMKEIERHLEEIEKLQSAHTAEFPFFYIPGYLAFFGEPQDGSRDGSKNG